MATKHNIEKDNKENKDDKKNENSVYKIFNHYAKDDDSEKEFSESIQSSLSKFSDEEEKKMKQEKKESEANEKKVVLEVGKKKMPFWLEIIINIIVIAVLFAVVRSFIFVPFNVDGSSMEGTLHDGEFIYVDRATPFFRDYERGDTIVFIPPYKKMVQEKFLLCKYHTVRNFLLQEGKSNPCMVQASFVKRVIGVEGDVVEIKEGHVYVTPKGGVKQEINQDFLLEENQNKTCLPAFNCQGRKNFDGVIYPPVPAGKYFVMGDNRQNSSDSRENSWESHFVEGEKIIGIVRAVFLSPQKLTLQDQMKMQEQNAFARTVSGIKRVVQGFANDRIIHQEPIITEK